MKNEYLRHLLSVIAYRFQKTIQETPLDFADFCPGKGSRTPREIVHHMYEVVNQTRIFILKGRRGKQATKKLPLHEESDRFHLELKNLDIVLGGKELNADFAKRLLQGPISDVLTHIGQLALMRRLKGSPVMGEDFSSAAIQTGIK